MNIKLSEIAEEKDGYAVKISATIVCPRNGRDWTTVVSGQGQTRSEAIESLMTSRKLRRFMGTQLRQEVTKLYPEETGSPKEKELSSESGSESQDDQAESRIISGASDQTDTRSQTSRSKGAKKSKRAEKQQKEEKKTPSSKSDGTTQESQSSADELGF